MTESPHKVLTRCASVPFHDDPCNVYARLRSLGHTSLLDSGGSSRGRYDIIAAQADGSRGLRVDSGTSNDNLNLIINKWKASAQQQVTTHRPAGDLPFYGGYIGHLSYAVGRRLQGMPARTDDCSPIATVHYYPWAVVQDRHKRCSWLVGEATVVDRIAPTIQNLLATKKKEPEAANFKLEKAFEGEWSLDDYKQRFQKVKNYISSGDCYQVNIGQPFSSRYAGDLFAAYRQLRKIAKAPFSGFFPLSENQSLVSLSPERFLTVDNRQVESRPIKGTRPRHKNTPEDKAAATALMDSDKERAENLMIVDLLRNDIGRYCTPGSVTAPELFKLESYATVHHLVSVVKGELSADHSTLDLLFGCMPGGSITGAPKRRAMEIIDDIEPAARNHWCGSLFYLSRHGRLDSNISIRTLFNEGATLHCWAGGGLVDDSQALAEYQEQRDKVGAFLSELERTL
ncbi:anthranilate synthase component I family protein [Congregibacter brevis]|uniref:Anthranilate synthase component I family protein n=1 Tax=Congregibacter brevis TaxID=3081201 RepID=A0ABZ0IA48_9GAMM|nr:anthranilate synthase component I family protein [Congregibacter sp. IMCC45268]